jgi:nucleoside-diphosphate-sugar epimerase
LNVFVAGASGAIGRPLVRQLVRAGHKVTGMTRRAEHAEEIRAAGARVAIVDAFDKDALVAAVAASRPEVVIHELTALPAEIDPRKADVYDSTNRVRTEGTRNLIEAARGAGVRRMVAQGNAFVYEPVGDWVKDEEAALMASAEEPFGSALAAVRELERQVTGTAGLEGLVLRYGFFYGPRTSYAADGYHGSEVRRRRFPIVGSGAGTFSFIHVDDAAAATVAACERGAPGIYNVCDDEPAPMREWLPVYAAALGANRPLRLPKVIVRLVAGPAVVAMATTLRGASNAKAKRELDWQPLYASWRSGFREALRG